MGKSPESLALALHPDRPADGRLLGPVRLHRRPHAPQPTASARPVEGPGAFAFSPLHGKISPVCPPRGVPA
ncbi:MAG: hypothetical protein MZV64_34280 [Ignavibacteriales bacterium]|nr:hypothetical protein [Ignavibacteriales bacterium]